MVSTSSTLKGENTVTTKLYRTDVILLKNIRFSLYYKVGRIFFFTFVPEYCGTSHYKRKNYAEKPCHCRVSGKSKND